MYAVRVTEACLPTEVLQLDALAEHLQELLHGGAVTLVAEDLLLQRLPEALVDDAELVVVRQHVLVVVHDQLGAVRVQHGRQLLARDVIAQQLQANVMLCSCP